MSQDLDYLFRMVGLVTGTAGIGMYIGGFMHHQMGTAVTGFALLAIGTAMYGQFSTPT